MAPKSRIFFFLSILAVPLAFRPPISHITSTGPLLGSHLIWRLRDVKLLAQGHTAAKGVNSGLFTSAFWLLSAKAALSLSSSSFPLFGQCICS